MECGCERTKGSWRQHGTAVEDVQEEKEQSESVDWAAGSPGWFQAGGKVRWGVFSHTAGTEHEVEPYIHISSVVLSTLCLTAKY